MTVLWNTTVRYQVRKLNSLYRYLNGKSLRGRGKYLLSERIASLLTASPSAWWISPCLSMFVDCHSLSLAPVKSRLVLPFWYRLTQVVLEKRPLNGCCCCRRCDLWFQVHEKVVDYTRCTSNTSVVCADYIETHPGATNCSCRVTFQLTDDFPVVAFLRAKMSATHTHTHTLIQRPFFRDYLGEPDPERQNQSGFYWSNRQWVAFSEKGPLNGRVCVCMCVCMCVSTFSAWNGCSLLDDLKGQKPVEQILKV